jgi:hypothetical protein
MQRAEKAKNDSNFRGVNSVWLTAWKDTDTESVNTQYMRNKDQNLPGENMSFKKIREFTLAAVFATAVINCVGWRGVTITAPEKVPQIEYKALQPVTINVKTTQDGSASFVGGMVEGKFLKEAIQKHYKDANINFSLNDDAVSNGYLITYNWDRKNTTPKVLGFVMSFLSGLTLTVIPFWSSYDMETKVRVYKSGALQKEYVYNASQTDFIEILMILGMPFAHPNYATEKIADAVVRRSLEDIKRDIQFK